MAKEDVTQTPSERLTNVLNNLTGRYVTLSVRDGSKWEGVLHTYELEASASGVELLLATKKGALTDLAAKPETRRLFPLADIASLECKYSLHDDLLGARTHALHEVRADGEISSGSHGKERELQAAKAWVAADGVDGGGGGGGGAAVSLDDWDTARRKSEFAGWDQFTVNEQKFGVTSTYQEELYTTRLNRAAVSAEDEATAARLAAEIAGTAADHALLAEERGQHVAESATYDEEARYSTVLQGAQRDAHIRSAGGGGGGGAVSGVAQSRADGPTVESAGAPAGASAAAADASALAARSKLNPQAKAFVFNPQAKEFVPGGCGSTTMGGMGVMGGAMGMGVPGGRPLLPSMSGFACGCAYPAGAMMGGGFGANAQMDGGGTAMLMGAGGPYQQMLRAAPAGGGYVLPQPFAGAPPSQMAATMAGMGARGPAQYALPPTPPGAHAMYAGGPQQMAAMRAMQGGAPPGGAQFAYAPIGAMQPAGGQSPSNAGAARFAGQGGAPGFGGPQPPRQVGFQPPRM